jgi:hypothetical protein
MDENPAEENTTYTDDSTETLIEMVSAELRRYRRHLAQSLNRGIDRLEPLFIAAEVSRKEVEISFPALKRVILQSQDLAHRTEWLRARAQGQRQSSRRREAILWEMAYRWQEFFIFFRCHWPIRCH